MAADGLSGPMRSAALALLAALDDEQ